MRRVALPEHRIWSANVQGTHDAMAAQAPTAVAERDRLAQKVARVEAERVSRDAERVRREAAKERVLRRKTFVAGQSTRSVVGVDPDSKLNGRATLEATKEDGDGPLVQLVSEYLWGYVRSKGGVHVQVDARLAQGMRINRSSQDRLRAMRQATRGSFVVGLVERWPRRSLVTPVDPVEELEKRVAQGHHGRWRDVEEGKTVIAYGARE